MIDLILYDLSSSWLFITLYLCLLFTLGCIVYIATKDFKLKNGKIKIYGLLLNSTDRDIIVISTIVLRTFLIIYTLLTFQEKYIMYIVMIVLSSCVFIMFYLKNVIYEIINTISLLAIIYFSYQLSNYLINIEYSSSINIVKMVLVTFGVLYTIYICLKELEEITANKAYLKESKKEL